MFPGDIEIDLYRISNGETIRWKGMSSGVAEIVQGAVLIGAGGVVAATFGFEGAEALRALFSALDGDDPGALGDIAFSLIGLIGIAAALALAWFGWRMIATAKRVAWAVTTKRLIRMIGGEADRARSWVKADIVKVERTRFGSKDAEGLAVTVRGRRRRGRNRNRVLMIVGPSDLADAERALAAMED